MKRQSACHTLLSPVALSVLLLSGPAMAGSGATRGIDQSVSLLAQAPSAAGPAAGPTPPAAGTFDVDEDAAQRALERTLTQAGALMLPLGAVELAPSIGYTRIEQASASLASVTDPRTSISGLVMVNEKTRRDETTAGLSLKAGLPFDSQIEAQLPYTRVRTSRSDDLGARSSSGSAGTGDLTIGLAKAFLHERRWRPDLIGRISYNRGNDTPSDRTAQLNGGYRQLQAEVIALKRQDPLAFTIGVNYSRFGEKEGLKPGDAASISVAALLAASPATSLQLGFTQLRRKEQEINGARVPGSDQTYATMTFGASSVVSRNVTLLTQFGIGLGEQAPKYSFMVTLPILFR